VMLGDTLLVIAWLRWNRGLRAYALGLGLPGALASATRPVTRRDP
jgi:hypothetical protein